MDPVSTILAALAAGAAAAAKDTAGAAVKDAYEHLKGVLRRKLGPGSEGKAALAAETSAAPEDAELRPALASAPAAADDEALAAAGEVLAIADPDGAYRRRYSVHVSGNVQGMVQGDHANVTMNFGPPQPPRG